VTGGIAANVPIAIDEVEDLQLAVDEAASWLLMRFPSASSIVVALEVVGPSLRAIIHAEIEVDLWPMPGLEESLAWRVITGLVDRAAAQRDDRRRPTIVLDQRLVDVAQA
jgi:hypothetical protein